MFYIEFDAAGLLIGRYTTMIHGENIPAGAVQVEETVFAQTIAETDGIWKCLPDGSIVKTPVPPPTADELALAASSDRRALLADAALHIAPLADAVELGTATQQEAASLLAWKQYRVDLSRIEQQPEYPHSIEWPQPPD